MDEALAWAQRIPNPDGVVELRPVHELEDFGDAMTPELRARRPAVRRARAEGASSQ